MSIHTEGKAQVKLRPEVFLNPVQIFNRDLSILTVSNYAAQLARTQSDKSTPFEGISLLEPLAASGIRSLRYYKEITSPIQRLIVNDINPEAVQDMISNFQDNGVQADIRQSDALDLMYSLRSQPVDVIDLDPYGSVAEFLDGAVQSVKDGGLLCLTSTDAATLCGNHPDTCFYKYGVVPTKAKYCHEFAVRTVLSAVSATANRYQKIMIPVLSLSVDFYIRVFVKIVSSAAQAKNSILNSSLVYQCTECPTYAIHTLGKHGKSKNTVNQYSGSDKCDNCGGSYSIHGPVYTGPLHDRVFIQQMLDTLPSFEFKMKDRIIGFLTAARDELDDPFYFDLSRICKFLKCVTPSQKQFRSAIRSLGYEISQSHTAATHYKTTANLSTIFDILIHWKKLKTPADKLLKNIDPSSAAYRILTKEQT